MKNFKQITFLACGLLLTLAALPVFAQQEKTKINKKPLQDFAVTLKEQVQSGKVDLTKAFSVDIESVLSKDGRFERGNPKVTKSEGDAAMVEVGKNFIIAVSDSGILQYLQDFGVEKLTFRVSQNDKGITAIIKTEIAVANRAKTMASGLNMLLKAAALQSKNEDDKELLGWFNVVADNKNFVINFAAPREAVHELLKKHLDKMASKESGK